ncbi:hypothetical protein SAVCW2_09700 [Streptomyces avermitilis]|nr:hypothetical protein SAVCW2_09700 [Streptomyces avermitilis]
MGAAVADDGFDFSPGAQVPLSGSAGQTAATFALASAAYRDNPVEEILKADNEWHQSTVKGPRRGAKILRPNLGEAFSRAVIDRMLGVGRNPLIQSFGTEPQVIVEHCLAAHNIRRERDNWLTAVIVLCGLIFLPGLIVWLLVFQIRTAIARREDKRASALGTTLLVAVGALAVIFLIRMPFTGFWGWYARAAVVVPVVGWLWAKQICERTAKDLRERWDSLLAGGAIGAKVPEAVPGSPGETAARAAAPVPRPAQRRAAVQLRLLRGPQGHTRHGHALGQLAARRGPGAARGGQGDPPLPQLGRHTVHPRPAAHAGARPPQHRRFPQAVDQALGRHTDR